MLRYHVKMMAAPLEPVPGATREVSWFEQANWGNRITDLVSPDKCPSLICNVKLQYVSICQLHHSVKHQVASAPCLAHYAAVAFHACTAAIVYTFNGLQHAPRPLPAMLAPHWLAVCCAPRSMCAAMRASLLPACMPWPWSCASHCPASVAVADCYHAAARWRRCLVHSCAVTAGPFRDVFDCIWSLAAAWMHGKW